MTARQSRFFFSPVVKNLSLAAVYFLAAKMSLSIAMVHPSAAAIWPPTAIAFSALLLLDGLLWPGIFLGAFLANLTTAGSITTSMAIAGGNTLEAVAAAFLVERFAGGLYAFERPQNVFRFALFAGAIATLASATIGV